MSDLPQPLPAPSSARPAAPRDAPGRDPDALEAYSTNPEDLVGRVLDGRYLIDAVLGRGAMAVVLSGRHLFLGKRVAIKVLHPALVALDEMKARFLREARAASGIQHEAVITVTDFGVAAGGLHYLVMEHLEGESLLEWSERRGMASADEVAHIGVQLCDALAAIHAAGYVHRDVKPENIWVLATGDERPRIKLLDLGIAAVMDEPGVGQGTGRGKGHRLTTAGQTLGTVLYMSPEQAMGRPLDGRSDLYALGCVLWELACDACVFDGTSQMDIMLKQTAVRPAAPSTLNPSLPAWFDTVIIRCLEKQPEDRFASADALRAALLAPELPRFEPAVDARPPLDVPEELAPRRGKPLAWIAGGAIVVSIAVVLIARPWVDEPPPIVAPTLTTIVVPMAQPTIEAATEPVPEPVPEPETIAQPEPETVPPVPPAVDTKPSTSTRPRPSTRPSTSTSTSTSTRPSTDADTGTGTGTGTGEKVKPPDELWRPERPTSPP